MEWRNIPQNEGKNNGQNRSLYPVWKLLKHVVVISGRPQGTKAEPCLNGIGFPEKFTAGAIALTVQTVSDINYNIKI